MRRVYKYGLILSFIVNIVLISGIAFILLSNNWLVGRGCLFDEGGFIELNNFQTYRSQSGQLVQCQNGKVVFLESDATSSTTSTNTSSATEPGITEFTPTSISSGTKYTVPVLGIEFIAPTNSTVIGKANDCGVVVSLGQGLNLEIIDSSNSLPSCQPGGFGLPCNASQAEYENPTITSIRFAVEGADYEMQPNIIKCDLETPEFNAVSANSLVTELNELNLTVQVYSSEAITDTQLEATTPIIISILQSLSTVN